MKKLFITVLVTVMAFATASAQQSEKVRYSEIKGNYNPKEQVFPAIELSNMDTSINPADDFYRYCNNNWLKNNPIPEENPYYDAFTEVSDRTKLQIKEIIDEAIHNSKAEQGSVAQKIRDFYNAGMDSVAINERGYSELLPYFEKIDQVSDKSQLAEIIGQLHDEGFKPFFTAGCMVDWKNADRYIMVAFQDGLSLPVPDLYLEEETQVICDYYVEHIANMFRLTGTDSILATQKAKNVLAMETELAKISMPMEEMLDPQNLYHFKSLMDFQASIPNFNWDNYFAAIGAPAFDSLNVASPDFFIALDNTIQSADLGTIKDYLRWKVITNSAPLLSDDLVTEDFNFFNGFLYGQEAQKPRWMRVLNKTSNYLEMAIGQLYVEKYCSAEAKEHVQNLVENLRMAFGERIKRLDWMSDETKARALHKLECINMKIGYPDKWLDYSKLEISSASYFQNVRHAIRFENARDMAKIGKFVDKDEWDLSPQTVNGNYRPDKNQITLTAAVLQPPFFNMDADDAVNYAAIGQAIAHEMTHGFDNAGRMYDEKGNLNNWWTEEDDARFAERTKQFVKLFDEFELHGHHINGVLTLDENIADLGGLNVAWDAYQMTDEAKAGKRIDGFSPAQRFFISYATVWRCNIRDEALELQMKEDLHSPHEARANRALGSMPHFYEAFDIPEGSKMYIAPEERAAIW
jgi:putative endopeptidase